VTVILAHLRAEARRRWPAWLAVVLLVGVVGGLVLGALAGARRTHTAYDRLVEDTEAWDALINPDMGADSALTAADVAELPGVRDVGTLDGVGAVLVADDPPTLGSGPLVLAARDDDVLVEFARPRVLAGSLFDPTSAEQVMVDDLTADHYGIRAGDHVEVATATLDDLIAWELAGAEGAPPMTAHRVTVAGVVLPHDSVVEDEAFAYGQVYLTPAFARAHELEPFFFGLAVDLARGTDVAAFRQAVQALAPDEVIEFKTGAAVRDTVARGTMPHTTALLLFAVVVGAAGVVVAGQATTRQLADLHAESATLAALGLDRRALRRAALARTGLLVGAGCILALVLAVAVSPVFPLGVADRAEIDPGVDVDPVVLLPGIAALAAALLGWAGLSARRLGRPAAPAAPRARAGAVERVVASLSSPIASTGLRASLAPGGGGGRTAVRGAIAGLGMAVAAVAATMTFGSGIDHLVATPSAYGWAWDAHVTLPSEEWETAPEEIIDRVDVAPGVDGWSIVVADQLVLDGERVPAVGIDYREGDVGPTILRGRRPEAPDEIALGGRTMDRLGLGIGDRVAAGPEGRRLEVVGQAVFPGLGTYPGADRTELGKGALLASGSLAEVGEGFGFESVVLDVADGRVDEVLDEVLAGQEAALEIEEIEVYRSPALPADVQSLSRVRSTPLVIAGVLAVLGGVAFAFVLVSGVRGRRREIALLKTFGFRGRDVAGTVAWQATTTALVACVLGIPLGIVAGRIGWALLADVLGVADDARVPMGLVALAVGVVVVANLLAVVPGVVAARTRPAEMLRTE